MASISKRDSGSWLARYRPVSGGAQKTRSFARKVDAKRWLDETTASIVTSQYIDPKAAKTTVRQYAKAWQAAQVTRASTRNNVDVALRLHVLPIIGDRPMGSVLPSDMQALVKMLSATLSPGTVRETYKIAGRLFGAAMDDRVIAVSPCHRVRLPHDDRAEVVVPTVEQITTLASGVPPRYRALVVLLAGSGLRIGEALGLGKSDVDFLRRTVMVKRQRLPSGVIGPPKTSKSARTVPLGKVVVDELAAHLANYPSEDALFTVPAGTPLGYSVWRHMWTKVNTTAKLDVDTHQLRHVYASALISGGASVKVIQARLGHASAVITLDTYGHLWPDDDTLTRTVIDAAFEPLEDSLRTKATL